MTESNQRQEDTRKLAQDLRQNATDLAKNEIAALKPEAKEAAKGLVSLGASAMLVLVGTNLIIFAGFTAISRRIPRASGLVAIGAGMLALSAGGALLGIKKTGQPLRKMLGVLKRDLGGLSSSP